MGRDHVAVALEVGHIGPWSLGAIVPGADSHHGPPVGRPLEVLHLLGGHGTALEAQGLDADVGQLRRIGFVGCDEVSLRGDVSADDVGDVIGEAELSEDLGSDFIVLDDANAGHLPAFGGPDVADVVQESGDDLLLVTVVFPGEVGRLQSVFKLRDRLAVVLCLS